MANGFFGTTRTQEQEAQLADILARKTPKTSKYQSMYNMLQQGANVPQQNPLSVLANALSGYAMGKQIKGQRQTGEMQTELLNAITGNKDPALSRLVEVNPQLGGQLLMQGLKNRADLSLEREKKGIELSPYEKSKQQKLGTLTGETEDLYMNMEANLPQLKETVRELKELGKKSTFTLAGRGWNFGVRQLAGSATKGGIAREKFISTINNQMLPLLKQTFGAAFTAQEGESLKATMGDPNIAPKEKEAVLDSFIEQKVENLKAKGRRLGIGVGGEGQATQQAAQQETANASDFWDSTE